MSGSGRLWLIGAGNMGGALAERWRAAGLAPVVVDPRLGHAVPAEGTPETLVLAVKPQVWREATVPLDERIGPGTLVVSIMAGVRLAALGARFPQATVARAMPNTPAARGQGITGLYSDTADAECRDQLAALFGHAGPTLWLDREDDFDALTAVSGSGPAYVFAVVEALAAAGAAAGLTPAVAARLAAATVTGAAALLDDGDPAALRAAVTSPGGTTAAGLAVLLPGLAPLLRATVAAAAARSRELGMAAHEAVK